jgi:hypothetical protein
MKKLLLIICLFVSLPVLSQELDGKWIDKEGDLSFTFTKDSIFIDTADSGCGCSIYKVVAKRITVEKYVKYDAKVVFSQDEYLIDKRALLEIKKDESGMYKLNIHYYNELLRSYDIHETYYIKRIGT